jgi:alanine racemase
MAAGASVGYGSAYTAEREMRIGIVACGYADGYPRIAPGGNDRGTPVLVDGVRTRTVGRVSMDMVTVDLTPVPAARVGSIATLWGRADDGTVLSIDEVAAAAGTVGYELMCARAPRVPVRVVGE